VHGNYLIFYRVHAQLEIVEVIHILHGARDYESFAFSRCMIAAAVLDYELGKGKGAR
jgi:hypothetical protein